MPITRLHPNLNHLRPQLIEKLSVSCKPHILIVTDMSFSSNSRNGFSLSQFVQTLKTGKVFGLFPKVTKAHIFNDGTDADINNFTFDHATHGLLTSRYDACFVFAFRRGENELSTSELGAIGEFMQNGGGFFATGDHEDLGAGLCKEIPRVRNMRKWSYNPDESNSENNAPGFSNKYRLSTNLPGDDNRYIFEDQSDIYPQRLFLNWLTEAGGEGMPHPLMQASPKGGSNAIKLSFQSP